MHMSIYTAMHMPIHMSMHTSIYIHMCIDMHVGRCLPMCIHVSIHSTATADGTLASAGSVVVQQAVLARLLSRFGQN